ncbi:MAG: HEAT repeat domain-containing protein [Bacteroidota bacterium]
MKIISNEITMTTEESIERLIEQLSNLDGAERERARKKLVKIGRPAVPSLMKLLSDRKQHMRWEGCKALGEMMDSTSAAVLVKALTDESVEVRWLAAEGLIALEKKALVPLLKILETDFESPYVREGAHHVLHALERQHLLSKDSIAVLDTLRYLEPKISVALAARKALQSNLTSDN